MSLNNKTLILDLDNTIFETRSIKKEVILTFITEFEKELQNSFSKEKIDEIIPELWDHPWNNVAQRHGVHADLFIKASIHFKGIEQKLQINPYADYHILKDLPCRKFLVTTSLRHLQESKIRALKIENDFTKILINDPFDGAGKKSHFKDLLSEFNLDARNVYVIGDDPESEIKAGNELGLNTVQILRNGVIKGTNAQYYIDTFHDLEAILKE